MKWLTRILFAAIIIVIALFGISFLLPSTSVVQRSITINKDPRYVYAILNNLRSYDKWMTWNQMDPEWKVSKSANTIGEGAFYTWQSKSKNVGNGYFSINKCVPYKEIICHLNFDGMGTFENSFFIDGNTTSCTVKWRMKADFSKASFLNCFMNKWMSQIGSFDSMAGREFEKSLANMKSLAESPDGIVYQQ